MTPSIGHLKDLRDAISIHPEHFNMDTWFRETIEDEDGDPVHQDYDISEIIVPQVEEWVHTCGTTACLAGWAILLFRAELPARPEQEDVAELLGVSTDLFYEDMWPADYGGFDQTQLERAIDLLDDLINGVEVF